MKEQISSVKMAVFWVIATCSLVEVCRHFKGVCCIHHQVDEATSTSETSVNFYQNTRRDNSEDSHLHIRRHENLKSHEYLPFS
jgi:hypothetical protein